MRYLPLFLLSLVFSVSTAQHTRYLEPFFNQVEVERDIHYATNISVLYGTPMPQELFLDLYQPAGDNEAERPVVILLHSGFFLPKYFNGRPTGEKRDSAVVELAVRLARMGYVSVAMDYRLGWLPLSEYEDVRGASFLQAIYRGQQDLRACVRYLRKTVNEDGNPHGIAPGRIAAWGLGTGGHLALSAAFLDRYEELLLPEFIYSDSLAPFINPEVHGDVLGLEQATLNLPSHTGYSSDLQLCVSAGGALPSLSWIEGESSVVPEPAAAGFHVPTDPWTPFGNGPVLMHMGGPALILYLSGARVSVERANEMGGNYILQPANELENELNQIVEMLQSELFHYPGQEPLTLSTDNFYPLLTPGFRVGDAPWEWWDTVAIAQEISILNDSFNINLSASELHNNRLLSNPDMSPEKGRAYIDTMIRYFAPRACLALELESCWAALSSTDIPGDSPIELTIAPNPASDELLFRATPGVLIQEILLYDMKGKVLRVSTGIEAGEYRLKRQGLPPGAYVASVKSREGTASRLVVLE